MMNALFGRGARTILFSSSIFFFKSKTMTWVLRLFHGGINQYFHLFEVLAVSWTNWKSDIYWWGILLSEQWDRSIFYDCYTRGTLAHWFLFKFVFVSLSLYSFFIHLPITGTIHWTLNYQVNTDPKINLGFRLNVLRKYKLHPLFDISRGKNEKIIRRYLVRSKWT